MTIFQSWFSWLSSLFFSKAAEIAIVGLQASGKTSFVNALGLGQWSEEVVPTVAFNLRKVKRNNISFKIWDVAGQPKFRTMWDRYCRGVDAIVFVVDSYDRDKLPTAEFELHTLLDKPELSGVPLLVLGNKNDLPGCVPVEELIRLLNLSTIQDRPVSCYSCSMKSSHNLDIIIKWLTDRAS